MIDLVCAQEHNLVRFWSCEQIWVHVPSFTEDNCVKCSTVCSAALLNLQSINLSNLSNIVIEFLVPRAFQKYSTCMVYSDFLSPGKNSPLEGGAKYLL